MDPAEIVLGLIAERQEEQEAAKALIEQAQVLQKQAEKQLERLPRAVREVLSAVPGELRKGVTEGSGEILRDMMRPAVSEAKELVKSLKAAATEAQASAKTLQRTSIIQGVFLLGAGLAVGLIGWAATGYLVKNRAQELERLDAAIAKERAVLANLQSETWRLELVEYQDGTRGIILPKGIKVDRTGTVQDGQVGIVITP